MTPKGGIDFWEWFDGVRGDLSIRQIERRANSPRGRIGNAYSARKEPSSLVCEAIADGLGLSRTEVFRQSGLLPSLPSKVEEEEEILHIYRSLSPRDRIAVRNVLRSLAGYGSATKQLDPYQEILNIIWGMTPDELKERIVVRLQETVKKPEGEMAERETRRESKEAVEKDGSP